jgi:hypothetical protein
MVENLTFREEVFKGSVIASPSRLLPTESSPITREWLVPMKESSRGD